MFSLANKTALITGAGSGIGAAIAQVFAQAGALVCVSDLNEQAAREVARQITSSGGKAESMALDVTQEVQCAAALKFWEARGESLQVLVNNAGIGHVGTTLQTSGADLDRLYQVNLRGAFNLIKVFLPGMVARRNGVIINLASIGGVVGVRDRAAYCTTKFALVGLTKCLALDHALDGIRANCICPGRVETPFVSARLQEYPDPQKAYQEMASTQAMKRMAKPEEIAHAALYLASDEAAFVTGSELIIDGGWNAGK